MIIRRIELYNYRRYLNRSFDFKAGINIIQGSNATGKSTVLEAIHYLILLRSNRAAQDSDMISFDKDEMVIKGDFMSNNGSKKMVVLNSKYFKKMNCDGKIIKKASDYVGFADVVSFTTEDIHAISGSPLIRRKMFDMFASQYCPEYIILLREYKNILKERNALLKDFNQLTKHDRMLLDVINVKFLAASKRLTNERRKIISQMKGVIDDIHYTLSNGREHCEIKYVPSCDDTESGLNERDILYKTSTVGPHRDDIWFYVNTENLSKYGSQGQKKTVMLSFKMSCVKMLEQQNKRKAIILLDDVFGELDPERQNCLLKFIENDNQTFITTPSLVDIKEELIQKSNIIYLEKEEV